MEFLLIVGVDGLSGVMGAACKEVSVPGGGTPHGLILQVPGVEAWSEGSM